MTAPSHSELEKREARVRDLHDLVMILTLPVRPFRSPPFLYIWMFVGGVFALVLFAEEGSVATIILVFFVWPLIAAPLQIFFLEKYVELPIRRRVRKYDKCEHGMYVAFHNCEDCKADQDAERRRVKKELEEKEAARARRIMLRKQASKRIAEERERLKALRRSVLNHLMGLEPYEFETAVGELFEKQGYDVRQTPPTGDAGFDLILVRSDEKELVECKRYRQSKVGRSAVQKLRGAMVAEGADAGKFVTTTTFTNEAIIFAGDTDIETIDGETLIELFGSTFPVSGTLDSATALCTQCGNEVRFSAPENVDSVECSNGHQVRNPYRDLL